MSKNAIIILVAGTIFIILFSWFVSIKEKRYHGIYRFFSFESILLLVLLNYPIWFNDFFSVRQLFASLLLLLSVYLAFVGFYVLVKKGKPSQNFENTSRLVTTNIYKYIRHPLYASLLYFGLGAYLKNPTNPTVIILVLIDIIGIILCSKEEEKEMTRKFGQEYREYMKNSKMFIPFVF